MTEDRSPKASEESMMANGVTKQRKKRKWDQPAESLMPAGVDVTGTLPLGVDGIYGSALLGLVPQSGPLLTNPTPTSFVSASQILQPPLVPPTSASGVQKLIQPKIQDELIAREIVINDADPSTRYKLTKRQTQEEIQKCTGAVVITRGKYRPPNALPDGEKPLYLHISAGAQLKDTVERIKAVDSAAYMVEEVLRQGQNSLPNSTILPSVSSNGQATHSLSLCLYLGFDPVPSLNIVSRIRGPNDQYINHIMNETGATVVLRGRGSGNVDTLSTEEAEQPLHLYLSSSNSKNLEDARILAENLLDTICAECGASRVLSSKTYGAVPPPQQLLGGASSTNSGPSCLPVSSMPAALLVPNGQPSSSNTCAPEMVQAGGLFCYGNLQQSNVSYVRPSVNRGTSYSGYGGIYPQATPLQQVALALRQSSPSTTSIPASTSQVSGLPMTTPSSGSSGAETDKRPPQKRKFQELPVSSKGATMLHQNSRQESEFLKPGLEDSGAKEHSLVLPQKKLVRPVSNLMPPPPPPPKFSSPVEAENGSSTIKKPIPEPKFFSSVKAENRNSTLEKPKPERVTVTRTKSSSTGPISDTLLKLMEYGEEDEDDDGADEEPCISRASDQLKAKPFWAV